MNIRSFIGDAIDSIKLADQIKSGKATPVVVKMVYVSGKSISADDYQEEYDKNITYNITAYEKVSLECNIMPVMVDSQCLL